MMVAVRMPCRLPALVLLGALAAPAAWAGDAPVAPLSGTSGPGTSVSGTSVSGTSVSGTSVSGTSVSGTSVSGTSVSGALEDDGGSSAESAPPPALGAEAAGPAAGTTAPGAAPEASSDAAPAADAGPTDAAAPDGGMAAKEPAMPAGGSRLLRALAELPTPGAAPAEGARPGTPRGFVAEGCPRGLLRRLLAGAAGEADALSALGIEREVLTLCRERQEIVAGLFETEKRLSELREAVRTPEPETRATAKSAVPAPRVEAAGEAPAVTRAAASPLRAALGGAEEKANETDARSGDTRAEDPPTAARKAPRYAWFSIIGTAGALRAGVSDGTGVWFVREGDALPGGATIAAIAGRPPAVRVTGAAESGEAILLPFRARPGAGQ